jgi:hypothetical protein
MFHWRALAFALGALGADVLAFPNLLLIRTTNSPYVTTVLADSPLAYWRFEESSGTTAADSTGNGRTGTYVNSPTLGSSGALTSASNGLVLNGSQYVNTTYDQTNATAYSIEAWFKTTSANAMILQDRGGGSGMSLTLNVEGGTIRWGVDSNSIWIGKWSTAAVNDGNWHHVVGTWEGAAGVAVDSSQFKIYLDGVLAASSANGVGGSATAPVSGTGGTKMGYHAPWGMYFTGSLDEVAIYGTALTATQVANHYSAR